MIAKDKQAAHMLLGKTLADGWKVVKKMDRPPSGTGGLYSSCYEVENNGRKGFLKAFDYSGAEKISKSTADQIKTILIAFTFERDILEKCKQSKCKNVIELLAYGEYEVEEAEKYPRVEYLILEYADQGDVRSALSEKRATMEWKFRSLHQLAKGLREIHNLSYAHQDIKPSNIVTTKNNVTKITDFGSAASTALPDHELPLHLQKAYAGTWEYAPPELLYGELSSDGVIRRIGCDLYLLGSMVAFYFTGLSMTALIRQNLDDNLSWTNLQNQHRYPELLSYVIMAFELALGDIERQIDDGEVKDDIILTVRYLCHPDPKLRGHKRNIEQKGPNYDLTRFITIFDRMARFYDIKGR